MYHGCMTTPTVCTVVVTGAGGVCGKPAVVTLPGGKYAECAEHAAPFAVVHTTPELHVGAPVGVPYRGETYHGIVTHIARVRAEVRFETKGGKVKTMLFPIEELTF